MSIVYLLQNQHKHYLDKSGEWVSGENSRSLFRAAHKDEAINRKVEFSVKNFDLRITIFEARQTPKGDIELTEDDIHSAPPSDQIASNDDTPPLSLVSPDSEKTNAAEDEDTEESASTASVLVDHLVDNLVENDDNSSSGYAERNHEQIENQTEDQENNESQVTDQKEDSTVATQTDPLQAVQ